MCWVQKSAFATKAFHNAGIGICIDCPTSFISHRSEDVMVDHVADLRRKRQEGKSCWMDFFDSMVDALVVEASACSTDGMLLVCGSGDSGV